MRITSYKTMLDEDKKNILVKEKSVNYMTETKQFCNPKEVVNLMTNVFQLHKQAEEYVYMLAMNTKSHLLGTFEISHGTVNCSVLNPREIYIRALLCGASNIILVHNHPSGEPEPSKEDVGVAKRLKEAGNLIGINFNDSIVIGSPYDYVSLFEKGLI